MALSVFNRNYIHVSLKLPILMYEVLIQAMIQVRVGVIMFLIGTIFRLVQASSGTIEINKAVQV